MREITYMPQEEPVAEKFTVHYDDGAMKEIGSGVIFGMDSEGHTDACYINMDAGRLVRVAVSALALCEQFGIISEVADAIRAGTMERVLEEMEVAVDEEPV